MLWPSSNPSGARHCPETVIWKGTTGYGAQGGFTHKAVSWDGIYDIIAISILTRAIISILIAD